MNLIISVSLISRLLFLFASENSNLYPEISFDQATTIGEKHVAATWSEKGKVHIWDLTRPLNAVNDSNIMSTYVRNEESPPPMFTFKGHQVEGFAIDWSPTTQGKLSYITTFHLKSHQCNLILTSTCIVHNTCICYVFQVDQLLEIVTKIFTYGP